MKTIGGIIRDRKIWKRFGKGGGAGGKGKRGALRGSLVNKRGGKGAEELNTFWGRLKLGKRR